MARTRPLPTMPSCQRLATDTRRSRTRPPGIFPSFSATPVAIVLYAFGAGAPVPTTGTMARMAADPRSVVLTALDRLNAHDLEGYYELCADDFVYVGTTERRGKAEARAVDEPLFAGLPDHWRRVERLLVSGDTVAVWLTFGGTPTANGRAFEAELCDLIEVRDGKIQSIRMYGDWPALMAALAP